MREIKFLAKDRKTGKWLKGNYAERYARENCQNLTCTDLEGVAVVNGQLVLLDECGNYAILPEDRFTIFITDETTKMPLVCLTQEDLKEIIEKAIGDLTEQECPYCNTFIGADRSLTDEILDKWLADQMQLFKI